MHAPRRANMGGKRCSRARACLGKSALARMRARTHITSTQDSDPPRRYLGPTASVPPMPRMSSLR
eukprot:6188521-Pleurochrysis_carterae.AAC.1